jgi:hypothetical protein
MVEDLAVLNDSDFTPFRDHRLVAVSEIDDRKPAGGETGGFIEMNAPSVWPAVLEHRVHPLQQGAVYGAAAREVVATADPAHSGELRAADSIRRAGSPDA